MTIRYKEYGDKNADLIMFLHGGGVSGWMWDKQIEFFKAYHCLVPDLSEHGLSNEGADFSIKGNAEQLIEIIKDKAKTKKMIIVGFSLGAQVAVQIISMNPDLVDYAIINSALVKPIKYKALIPLTIRLSFPLIKNKWFSKLQAKTLYLNEAYFEKYYEESCRLQLDTLVRVLEENMSFEIPKKFKDTNTKILVTVGAREKAIMVRSAKDLVDMNSNCVGVMIPEVGHGISIAKPELFNEMVEAWLQEKELPSVCNPL